MKPRFERIAGFALAALRHVTTALAGLLTIPLVARELGADALGLWAILGTSAFALGLADMGLGVAVQRASVRGDVDATRRTIGVAVSVIAFVAPALALASYGVLLDLPTADVALLADARRAAVVAFAGGALGAFASPFRSLLVVRGALARLTRVRVVAVLLQVGVTWSSLVATRSLVAPALGVLAGALVETLGCAIAARQVDPGLRLGPRRPTSARALLALLGEGAASLAVNAAGILALRFDVVILGRFCPLATVAAYGVASRVVDQSFTLAKQTSLALLPKLARRDDRERAVRVGTALLGGAVAAGMGALVTRGDGLLVAWAGEVASRPETAVAMSLLAGAAVLAAGHEVAASALTLAGRSAWDAALPLVLGYAVNLVFSVAFARTLGVVAVSLGTLLGTAVTSVALWSRARLLLGWERAAVLRTLSPVVIAGAAALLAGRALAAVTPSGLAWSLVGCVLATALGLGASFVVSRRTSS